MFWDKKADRTDDRGEESAADRHLRRRKLNPELQKLLDKEEEFIDNINDGSSPDSLETPYRYAAYATRIRTLLLSAHRYIAYTSEVGESFRPVSHPYLVRGAYGVSWAYLLGDVGYEGYKAYVRNQRALCPQSDAHWNATSIAQLEAEADAAVKKVQQHDVNTLNSTASDAHPMPWIDPDEDTWTPWATSRIPLSEDYRAVMAERAVFQGIASMGLPAFTIHSVVKYSGKALKGAKTTVLRTWGPIGLGLSIVPFLPYVFDQPVEHAVKWSFQNAFRAIGGPNAVPPDEIDNTVTAETLESLREARKQKREERQLRRAERRQIREKDE